VTIYRQVPLVSLGRNLALQVAVAESIRRQSGCVLAGVERYRGRILSSRLPFGHANNGQLHFGSGFIANVMSLQHVDARAARS
jgi:hypothetical protein